MTTHAPRNDTQAAPAAYDAFISYKREEPDIGWATWLQHALETYRVPAPLRSARPEADRRLRVFRDETETSASPNLSRTLEDALERSRYLIVVASPRSAKSPWVEREVRWFLDHGRRDRILLLLTEGDEATSFPRVLRGIEAPLAADVRPPAPPTVRTRRRLARLRLLAPLLDVAYDDLARRDAVRRRRTMLALSAAGAVLLAGAGWLTSQLLASARQVEETSGLLGVTQEKLDQEAAARKAADETATRSELAATEAKAKAAREEAARKQAEDDAAAIAEKARLDRAAKDLAEAASKASEEAAAAERAKRAAETSARRTVDVGVALERARDLVEGGKPREALAEAFAAYELDPASAAAQILLGRLLRAREPLEAEGQLPVTGATTMFRASPSGDALVVGATGANYQPAELLWAPGAGAIGTATPGTFAATARVRSSRDGTVRLSIAPAFTGDPSVRLWRRGRSDPVWTFPDDPVGVSWGAVSPDGARFAIGRTDDASVEVRDGATGALVKKLRGPSPRGVFLEDGTHLAVARFKRGLEILDVETGNVVATIDLGKGLPGNVLASGPDVLVLAMGGEGTALIDLKARRVTARWAGGTAGPPVELSSGPAPFVVDVDEQGVARAWDVATGKVLREVAKDAASPIVSAGVRPGRREMVTHHADTTARLWPLTDRGAPTVFGPIVAPAFPAPSGLSTPTPFDAKGERLLLLAERGTLAVFEVATGRLLERIATAPDAVGACLSPDGAHVDLVTATGRTERWAVHGKPVATDWTRELPDSAMIAALSPDGTRVALGTVEGHVIVLRTADGSVAWEKHDAEFGWVTGLAFSGTGTHLVACPQYERPARVFDAATGKVSTSLDIRKLPPRAGIDTPATFYVRVASLAGRDEVLSYGSNGVTVWSCATGRSLATLVPPRVEASALPSADGAFVVAEAQREVSVWGRDGANWREISRSAAPPGQGTLVALRSTEGLTLRLSDPAGLVALPYRKDARGGSLLEGEPPLAHVECLPDGTIVAVRPDGTIPLFGLAAGPARAVLPTRPPLPNPLPFGGNLGLKRDEPTDRVFAQSPDGQLLAHLGDDGELHLLDLARRLHVARFVGGDGAIFVAWADAGSTLLRVGDRRVDGIRVDRETRGTDALRPILERLSR